MMRILDNPGVAKRSNFSLVILAAVLLYGIWELWLAATVGGDQLAFIFGILFIGGAAYGIRTTLAETRDLVTAFDAEATSGKAALTLWRPLSSKRIETTLDQITGWRLWVETGSRRQRSYFLLAREPSHDKTLRFELTRGMTIPDELRALAPEAIEDFERETGVGRNE
jgi:hypothetical protein